MLACLEGAIPGRFAHPRLISVTPLGVDDRDFVAARDGRRSVPTEPRWALSPKTPVEWDRRQPRGSADLRVRPLGVDPRTTVPLGSPPRRGDEPLGLSARWTPNRTPPSNGTTPSATRARNSVPARCACIRGTRSVGSPTTANAQAGFAFHDPTRRRPVREPVFTTPRDLPPHGKTVEAPYSKLGLRHASGLVRERDVQRGGAGLVVACRILRSIR